MKAGVTPPAVRRPAPFRKSKLADRGKTAEDATQKYLERWAAQSPSREFNRLPDTKAAGRVIKAAPADFEVFCAHPGLGPMHGLIEVKETEHDYRLDRSRLTQMPRLRRRHKCGGQVYVLVLHSKIGRWRCMTAEHFGPPLTTGSWDLRSLPLFMDPQGALCWASSQLEVGWGVFDV